MLLVGESGSGKTALTERLVHNRPPRYRPLTSGSWSTQLLLSDLPQEPGMEREVWLWDFGGPADQRLIHQLDLDHTALVLHMFDSDRESVVPGLREWQPALARSVARGAPTLLRTHLTISKVNDKVNGINPDLPIATMGVQRNIVATPLDQQRHWSQSALIHVKVNSRDP